MANEQRWRTVDRGLRKYSPVNSSRTTAYLRAHVFSLMPPSLHRNQTAAKSDKTPHSLSPEARTAATERCSPIPWERRRSSASKGSQSSNRLDAKSVHLEQKVYDLRRDMSEVRTHMHSPVPQQYQDIVNYINFLPQTPGQHQKLRVVTDFLKKCKQVHKTEFIDKEAAVKCREQKCEVSEMISRRLWKPKMWRHAGRVITSRFENQLLCYWR